MYVCLKLNVGVKFYVCFSDIYKDVSKNNETVFVEYKKNFYTEIQHDYPFVSHLVPWPYSLVIAIF